MGMWPQPAWCCAVPLPAHLCAHAIVHTGGSSSSSSGACGSKVGEGNEQQQQHCSQQRQEAPASGHGVGGCTGLQHAGGWQGAWRWLQQASLLLKAAWDAAATGVRPAALHQQSRRQQSGEHAAGTANQLGRQQQHSRPAARACRPLGCPTLCCPSSICRHSRPRLTQQRPACLLPAPACPAPACPAPACPAPACPARPADEHFRVVYDAKGRFVVHRITKEEASYKLCKVGGRAGGRALCCRSR